MQKQLDGHQQPIQMLIERLDQMHDMMRTLIEHHHVPFHGENLQESRMVLQEDRGLYPKE